MVPGIQTFVTLVVCSQAWVVDQVYIYGHCAILEIQLMDF